MVRRRRSKMPSTFAEEQVALALYLVSVLALVVAISLHLSFDNLLTAVLEVGAIVFLVGATLVKAMISKFRLYKKTNQQHLISHGYAQGVGLYAVLSVIPAIWLTANTAKIGFFPLFVGLVGVSGIYAYVQHVAAEKAGS